MWEVESGFKDDFVVRVDSPYFELNEQYNSLNLHLVGTDLEDPEGDVQTLYYGCGTGWESEDGGIATHIKRENFTKQSKVGRLIERISEIVSEDSNLAKAFESIGKPTEAGSWMNLVFHMVAEEKEYSLKDRDTGELKTGMSRIMLPTEIWINEESWVNSQNGPVAVATAATPAKVKSDATRTSAVDAAKAKLVAKRAQSGAGNTASVTDTLIALAQQHDQITFSEKALELDEVLKDDSIVEQVIDDSDSGFWAKNQK